MTVRQKSLRSSTPNKRPDPGTRSVGEIYTNFPDQQLGVIDENQNAIDLIGVRYFSALGQYFLDDVVVNGLDNVLYQCIAANGPGAFNAPDWTTTADSFEKRLLGYSVQGLHEEYVGDIDLILKNSLYTINSGTIVNAPAAFSGIGFLETVMWSAATKGKQHLTALTNDNASEKYTRVLSGGLWQPWSVDRAGSTLGAVVELPGIITVPANIGLVEAAGQILLRADYPAFWDYLQANAGLISDLTWLAAQNGGANGVGYYSMGDGVTDFRMVDLRGEFRRGLNPGGGGSNGRDPDRGNDSLDWQDGANKSHSHGTTESNHTHPFTAQQNIGGFTDNGGSPDQRSVADSRNTSGAKTNLTINADGGSEARPRNIPVLVAIQVA